MAQIEKPDLEHVLDVLQQFHADCARTVGLEPHEAVGAEFKDAARILVRTGRLTGDNYLLQRLWDH